MIFLSVVSVDSSNITMLLLLSKMIVYLKSKQIKYRETNRLETLISTTSHDVQHNPKFRFNKRVTARMRGVVYVSNRLKFGVGHFIRWQNIMFSQTLISSHPYTLQLQTKSKCQTLVYYMCFEYRTLISGLLIISAKNKWICFQIHVLHAVTP